MSIVMIKGPAKSGKSALGNALRNDAINGKRGALLVDDKIDISELHYHIEKIIVGVPLPEKPDVNKLPWKKDPTVILIGDRAEQVLKAIEELVPGFTKKMGPVTTIQTTAAAGLFK